MHFSGIGASVSDFGQMMSVACGDHIGNLSDGSIVHAFFPFVWKLSGADPSVVAVIAAYGRVGGIFLCCRREVSAVDKRLTQTVDKRFFLQRHHQMIHFHRFLHVVVCFLYELFFRQRVA